jgi:uridylate kinase
MSEIKYKRVLLKLSGEALAAGGDDILNFDFIGEIAKVLKMCVADGVEIAIIVGAGNIWRGKQGGSMACLSIPLIYI